MALRPQAALSPTCILNGKSVHLQAAVTYICAHFRRIRCGGAGRRDEARRRHFIFGRACVGERRPVAGKLAGTNTALGVLPMGTLNHFAKDVGIPLNLEAAVYNLFTGQIKKVDVGEVNRRGVRQQFGCRLGSDPR
jgi:Diacylglycerol kinase catalytic domain